MKILALDPSSTRTGYAVMTSIYPDGLIDAGVFTPNRQRDTEEDRIDAMIRDCKELITGLCVDKVVIEVSSGKVGKKRHGGAGAGLAIYGMAVGEFRRACKVWCATSCMVVSVRENDWTRGVPKQSRNIAIKAYYPKFAEAFEKDTGGDMADAIGLGQWWLTENQFK